MNKKLSIISLISLLLTIPVFGSNTQNVAGLSITPSKVNLGTINGNSGSITKVVTIQNTSSEPITIESTKASCGCTTSKLENATLAPNQSTKLDVTFNPTNLNGKIRRQVYVSVKGVEKKIIIPINAEVRQFGDWNVSPSPVVLNDLNPVDVFIFNPSAPLIADINVKQVDVFPSNTGLQTNISKHKGRNNAFILTINPSTLNKDNPSTRAYVRVKFSDEKNPISIPVNIKIGGKLTASPSTLFVKRGMIDSATTLVKPGPPILLQVKDNPSYMQVDITPVRNAYSVKISIPDWSKVPTSITQRQEVITLTNGKTDLQLTIIVM